MEIEKKEKMIYNNKIVMVSCPCWGRETPPLSISLLGSNLRRRGYETYLFDVNNIFYHGVDIQYKKYWGQESYSFWANESSVRDLITHHNDVIESILKMILDTGSKVISFSITHTQLHFSLELASRIKIALPDSIIIFGGPQTSLFYSGMQIIQNQNVDAIVLHEGDETLPQALCDLNLNGHFSQIPGLIFKKNGSIIEGGMRDPIKSLDDLPFPDYSDFDLSTYANPHRLDISSSRSCINNCHFCDERNYFQRYRFRSGKSLYEEIVYQLNNHPSVIFFNFSDSALNGAINALREFCELLIKNKIMVNWGGQAIIRKEMTPDLLKLMRESGCQYLSYGLESGSNKVLEGMNKKRFTVELASEVLKFTHSAGINTYVNVMFGYPTETDADFFCTLDFIKQNREWIDGVSPSQSFMVIVKNTYLYNHLAEFDIIPESHFLYWKTNDGKNTYPIRFKRYEIFCKLCINLQLTGVGVVSEKIDKWQLLGEYYYYEKNYNEARECFETDLLQNGFSQNALDRFLSCCEILNKIEEGHHFINIFQLDQISPKLDTCNQIVSINSTTVIKQHQTPKLSTKITALDKIILKICQVPFLRSLIKRQYKMLKNYM